MLKTFSSFTACFGLLIFALCDSQLPQQPCTFHWKLCLRLYGLSESPSFTARWITLRWCRGLFMLNMRMIITRVTSLNLVVPTTDSKVGIVIAMFAPRRLRHLLNAVGYRFTAWLIVLGETISIPIRVGCSAGYMGSLCFTKILHGWMDCYKGGSGTLATTTQMQRRKIFNVVLNMPSTIRRTLSQKSYSLCNKAIVRTKLESISEAKVHHASLVPMYEAQYWSESHLTGLIQFSSK